MIRLEQLRLDVIRAELGLRLEWKVTRVIIGYIGCNSKLRSTEIIHFICKSYINLYISIYSFQTEGHGSNDWVIQKPKDGLILPFSR